MPGLLQAQDLIVLGDSITEAFRGKGFGTELKQFSENKAAWQALFSAKYKAGVYSISGLTKRSASTCLLEHAFLLLPWIPAENVS